MATARCLRVSHMSSAEKRAYVRADNKLALNAGWDEELLALELKELIIFLSMYRSTIIGKPTPRGPAKARALMHGVHLGDSFAETLSRSKPF